MTLPGWVGVGEHRGRLGGLYAKNVTIYPTQAALYRAASHSCPVAFSLSVGVWNFTRVLGAWREPSRSPWGHIPVICVTGCAKASLMSRTALGRIRKSDSDKRKAAVSEHDPVTAAVLSDHDELLQLRAWKCALLAPLDGARTF